MPSHPFVVFCDQVCKSIRWPPAQRLAREELTAHLEDHAAALEAQGVPPEEAATRAVEAMGDPKEIGQQLDRCHGPFIPRLSQFFAYCACVMFLFGFCIGVLNRSGPFRNDAFLLSSPTYPDWGGTMLCQGDAQGSGSLGGYAISAKDAALIRLPATKYSPSEQEIQATVTPVVICTDPNVVRVEAQLISLGTSERSDPQAAVDSHGVSPAFTQVADGVWVAPSTWVPGPPEDSGSTWLAWCQGYDTDGNLVCQDQPIY